MAESRQYDTVAFDVRDNATMLFFAKTTDIGEINDYLLLMRTIDEDFDESIYIEINEQQFGGHNLIREASLTGNVLTLRLHEPAEPLGGQKLPRIWTASKWAHFGYSAICSLAETPEAPVASPQFSLYIVRCADGKLYTGIATDVEKRLAEHVSGSRGAKYLRGKGPLVVVFSEAVGDRALASQLEYRVKQLSRVQKLDLIEGRRRLVDLQ
jgi:putative endonuclease